MEIIRKQDVIKRTAERYKNQYQKQLLEYPRFHPTYTHQECYERLLKAKTEEEVNKIIGVTGWASNICNECNQDSNVTVLIGEEPNIESNTANICLDCLKKALSLAYSSHNTNS